LTKPPDAPAAQAPAGDDVAQLREELDLAQRRLAEAHKMASLGRLAAGIVHEINTPIGSIFSNNEVILRSLARLKEWLGAAQAGTAPLPQKAIDTLNVVSGLAEVDKIACERIAGVIRSLKTFARVQESDLVSVDVNDLLRATMKLAGSVFRRRILMESEFAELPPVECFPGLMSQVFLNLVVNAGQAIPEEGRIGVRTCREGDCVHISVQDNGPGIPPEMRTKIFTAGFSTKPLGEGTGLGLSISREIVEDTHRGTIGFESEMGKGSTFHVRIPIEQRQRS
jgi:two-component system NtrC family sensor kinase